MPTPVGKIWGLMGCFCSLKVSLQRIFIKYLCIEYQVTLYSPPSPSDQNAPSQWQKVTASSWYDAVRGIGRCFCGAPAQSVCLNLHSREHETTPNLRTCHHVMRTHHSCRHTEPGEGEDSQAWILRTCLLFPCCVTHSFHAVWWGGHGKYGHLQI